MAMRIGAIEANTGAARSDKGASPMTRGDGWEGSVRFCAAVVEKGLAPPAWADIDIVD